MAESRTRKTDSQVVLLTFFTPVPKSFSNCSSLIMDLHVEALGYIKQVYLLTERSRLDDSENSSQIHKLNTALKGVSISGQCSCSLTVTLRWTTLRGERVLPSVHPSQLLAYNQACQLRMEFFILLQSELRQSHFAQATHTTNQL